MSKSKDRPPSSRRRLGRAGHADGHARRTRGKARLRPRGAGSAVFVAAGTGVALGAILAACAGMFSLPDEEPTIAGEIVAVTGTQPGSASPVVTVHIKTTPVDMDACGIIFRVTADTDIGITASDGTLREGEVADLRIGSLARAWASGGVAESCPAQATAAAIELLPPGAS